MGLDVVELVMEIEDAFDVPIPDEEFQHLRTVGDLYEYVVARNEDAVEQPAQPRLCLTMATFARLRPALQKVAGVSRRSIRPGTPVDQLSPPSVRRGDWDKLAEFAGLTLPRLHRPLWLVGTITATTVAIVSFAAWSLAAVMPLEMAWIFAIVLVAPLLVMSFVSLTHPLAKLLPANCDTVGGLSRVVLAQNFRVLQEKYQGWGSADVWGTMCGIISEQLGVPLEQITYEASFVEDLGAD